MDIPEHIIVPPLDVREVIDKTAGYIHRNGGSFEQRMKERQMDNKQFQFLFEHDAYYGYYNWKLNNYKEGALVTTLVPEETLTEQVLTKDDSLKTPRELQYYLDLLPMSPLDFDIIKMCAKLVAINGDAYLQKLLEERRELSLDFLKPDHSLHNIFRKLVIQFQNVISPPQELIERLQAKAQDSYSVLEDAFQRLEYDYKIERDTQSKEEEKKKQQLEYASIDWQDFVLVATVDIDDADKVSELPLPLSIAELQYRSLEQKKLHSLIEEAAPDFDIEPQQLKVEEEPKSQQQQPKTSRPVPKGMNIRSINPTRGVSPKLNEERMVKSPFSNQMIPESKLKQHIDIAFRDPRYKEEKRRYESKVKGSNLNTDEVLSNIKTILTGKRGGEEDEEENSKKRKIQWDGYEKSKKYVSSELQRGVTKEMVQEQKRKEIEKRNKIGPH